MAVGPGQLPALSPWPCPRLRVAEVLPSAAALGEKMLTEARSAEETLVPPFTPPRRAKS